MIVARQPEELAPGRRAAAIGSFDGVHAGHRRVLEAASATGLRVTVVTFDPHPRAVLGGRVELLTTTDRKLELLSAAGVEDVLLIRFDKRFAALTPDAFAAEILRGAGIEAVAAGNAFRFGRDRAGDLALLERLGFDVRRVPLVESISSSHVRRLVATGDMPGAAKLLGRPHAVEGIVVHGEGRGRQLGFPTANLDVPRGLLVPPEGVYAGAALGHRAAISIGTNPQFGGVDRTVEAHLLDFDGDLYDQRLIVQVWEPLRGQLVFGSVDELVEQIASDVERTRSTEAPA